MHTVIAVMVMFLAVASSQDRPGKRFRVEELDHPYVMAKRHATFFAGISRSTPTCGWLKNFHDTTCFYCVDEVCDSIIRDDKLFLHHETDGPGCTNELRVLTHKHEKGVCGPWIDRIAMILPQ